MRYTIRLIKIIWFMGVINFILLIVALCGIVAGICGGTALCTAHFPTRAEISDSRKEAIPFEALTEEQLQEGAIVEGRIFWNLDEFTGGPGYSHYAVLLGDKVMSVAVDSFDFDNEPLWDQQADDYKHLLAVHGLSVLQYNSQDEKMKSTQNDKTVKQIIQEQMQHDSGIAFRGKVVKMDETAKDNLRKHVIPLGKEKPAFKVLPYEIRCMKPIDWAGIFFAFVITVVGGIIGIAALGIFILRMRTRANKSFL